MVALLSCPGDLRAVHADASKTGASLRRKRDSVAGFSKQRSCVCKGQLKASRERPDLQAVHSSAAGAESAALSGVTPDGNKVAELQAYHLMQERLKFKFPRSRKMLLVVWSMLHLRQSTKGFVATAALYSRYVEGLSASKRVPEADFESELVKALALLSISPRQGQSVNQQGLKGIAWAEVPSNTAKTLENDDQAGETPGTIT